MPLIIALLILLGPLAAERTPGPVDPRELETFLDGLVPGLLRAHHGPGAVISIVRDGKLLFEKGYGYADVDFGRPMDPDRTIMRVASVSKLFTATAAMQLVAAGKLDLHADVNQYLDSFKIQPGFNGPVTLHHLLTHTGGFDDRFMRSSLPYGTPIPSLGSYLAERMPPRVMPVGRVVSYSNHGIALAGHLVELASGLSFPEYMTQRVLGPMGMLRSRFFLSVPLDPDLAVPYRWQGGRYVPLGYDFSMIGPGAELNTTARDMANFMIAQLAGGRWGNAVILPPEATRAMQEQHFSIRPDLPGVAYGFLEGSLNGYRTLGHGGSWLGFRSQLLLIPELNLGLFYSINADIDQGAFTDAFLSIFADRYLPPTRELPQAIQADNLEKYAGTYLFSRRYRSDLLKLGALVDYFVVTAASDGLIVQNASGATEARLLPVGLDTFRVAGEDRMAVFFTEPDSGTDHLVIGSVRTLDRVQGLDDPRIHLLLLVFIAVLFIATPLGWSIGFLARLAGGAGASRTTVSARWIGALACLLPVGAFLLISKNLQPQIVWDYSIRMPQAVTYAVWALHLSVPFLLALPFFALTGAKGVLARLHYLLLASMGLVLVWQMYYWNVIGPAAWL